MPPAKPRLSWPGSKFASLKQTRFWFTGERGASFSCKSDSQPWVPCTRHVGDLRIRDQRRSTQFQRQAARHRRESLNGGSGWTVDTIAEKPPIDSESGPPALTRSRDAEFSFHGEREATLQCALNFGPWKTCSSPMSVKSGVREGLNTFQVRQIDRAQNVSYPWTRTWTVDATNPVHPCSPAGRNCGSSASSKPAFGSQVSGGQPSTAVATGAVGLAALTPWPCPEPE